MRNGKYVKHDMMAPAPREHPTFKAAKRKLAKAAKQATAHGVVPARVRAARAKQAKYAPRK